jgi:hypothetical protein
MYLGVNYFIMTSYAGIYKYCDSLNITKWIVGSNFESTRLFAAGAGSLKVKSKPKDGTKDHRRKWYANVAAVETWSTKCGLRRKRSFVDGTQGKGLTGNDRYKLAREETEASLYKENIQDDI